MSVDYLHLPTGGELPNLGDGKPFKAVIVIEETITEARRGDVAEWLVESGCLYAMAWGQDCSAMDDEIDVALLIKFDHGEIPDDHFIMTTWHANESLAETYWFAAHCAHHPTVPLERTVIVHIGADERRSETLKAYRDATAAT